ncbi:unnamed protein product [Hymenolepis diminuta]|uniref:Leucine-rich repeat and WD repeat-containing protein 1 WD domain-containing protein n=2 Tax=Hymenolepis diminuta TaxID=6216 RepID=A0A564YRC0_HYMDI|nr:unnamed protein product [Hymenolepis diminuta]
MGVHSMFSNFFIRNVKDDIIQGKEELEKANIGKIYKESLKVDSVPPVQSLTQLGKKVKYRLVRCILCYTGQLSCYNSLWSCAFEPDINDPKKTTYISAVCGGESVYLINCLNGMILKLKYYRAEDFRAVAWTTVKLASGQMLNLLAVAGKLKRIRLFHSHYLINYTVLNGHENEISCLTFHPSRPTVLFSGDRQANIYVWDINVPTRSKYCHYLLMRLTCPRPSFYPVLGLVVMPNYDTLLASCGDGIFAWTIKDFRRLLEGDKRPPTMMEIKIPTNHGPWFDGLARLSENLVVVNSVEEGEIYVFDLGQNFSAFSFN